MEVLELALMGDWYAEGTADTAAIVEDEREVCGTGSGREYNAFCWWYGW